MSRYHSWKNQLSAILFQVPVFFSLMLLYYLALPRRYHWGLYSFVKLFATHIIMLKAECNRTYWVYQAQTTLLNQPSEATNSGRIMLFNYSLVGRRGYRVPPGNQFLIDVSRSEKYYRKRFAMLKSWQNVPHTIFMQISDAITGKCILLSHISANSALSSTIKVSNPMFWGSKIIIKLFLKWSAVSNRC